MSSKYFHNYKYDSATQRHSFEIHDLDISAINAIRRTILTDIPVVGFLGEDVGKDHKLSFDIKVNTGPLHNEFMQHRLGLIPLHLNEMEVEGFIEESYHFRLHVKNDGNMTRNVTTDDFQVFFNDKPLSEKDVRRILPHNAVTRQPILITRLRTGEELHAEGTPIKSTARVHAGFMPVSLCAFHYMVDPAKTKSNQTILERERSFYANAHGDPTKIIFELETEMGLDYAYLVSKAMEIIQQRIENLLQDVPSYARPSAAGNGVDFEFPEEDDTMGHLLQAHLFQKYIREERPSPSGKKVSYVGYYCPHPLDAKMVLRVVLETPEEDATIATSPYVEIVSHAMREMKTLLEEVRAHWGSFLHTTKDN